MDTTQQAPTATDLQPLLDSWISSLAMRSASTARSYRLAVSRFLEHLGDEPLSVDNAASYLPTLDGLAPASKAHYISAVRSFLRFARARGLVAESLDTVLVRPRVAVTSFGRYLDEGELRQLVEAAASLSDRHLATVLGLALTGLRVSELAGARWRDLFCDPQGRVGLRVIGKGEKERVVKVRDDLLQAFATLRGSAELDARDATPLIRKNNGTGYSARGLHKLVAEAVHSSGIKKPASPHWLRHTHATLAASGGASALVIQASLGHSRLETSQRYIHWAKGLAESTVDSLPSFTD